MALKKMVHSSAANEGVISCGLLTNSEINSEIEGMHMKEEK